MEEIGVTVGVTRDDLEHAYSFSYSYFDVTVPTSLGNTEVLFLANLR